MKKVLLMCLSLILLASCGPSINLELQKRVNEFSSKKKNDNYPSSGSFVKVLPYNVGQWILYSTVQDNKKSITKTSIIDKEDDGWVFENYNTTEFEEEISQYCLKGVEKAAQTGNVEDIQIMWMKVKKDGKVEKVDGVVLSFMQGMFRKNLGYLAINFSTMKDGGKVTVPAGTFSGTLKNNVQVSVFGVTYDSESFMHSDVPINGMVKTIIDNGKGVSELLDFGLTGAKGSL